MTVEVAREPSPEQWRLAFKALAGMVLDEWPGNSLAEIVSIWGDASPPAVIDALHVAQAYVDGKSGTEGST